MTENIASKTQTVIKSVTRRAAVILSLLLFLTTTSATGAVYTGSKSGELKTKVVEPINRMLSGVTQTIGESLKERGEDLSDQPSQVDTSSEVKIESKVEINVGDEGVRTTFGEGGTGEDYQIYWVYPSLPSGGSYEDFKEAHDEWWEKVQEQNRNLAEQSKKDLEQFRQESQQRLEEFKLQGEQGMEEFRREMERKQQEFLQEHGIEP